MLILEWLKEFYFFFIGLDLLRYLFKCYLVERFCLIILFIKVFYYILFF